MDGDRLGAILDRQTQLLGQLVRSLQTIENFTRADRTEQPFPSRPWVDELAWKALFSTAMDKTKESVDIWRSSLNTILIFVGLFLAVITGFQIPVIQDLAPDPTDAVAQELQNLTSIILSLAVLNGLNTSAIQIIQPEAFHPATSTSILSLLWSGSIVLSLFGAFVALLGIRWLDERLRVPREINGWISRTHWHKKRELFANEQLSRILHLLQPLILLSIALFLVGYIYQGYFIANSDASSRMLYASGAINSIAALGMAVILIYSLYHVYQHPESPFATPLTQFLRKRHNRLPGSIPTVATDHKLENLTLPKQGSGGLLLTDLVLETTEPERLELVSPALKTYIENWSDGTFLDLPPRTSNENEDLLTRCLLAIIRMLRSDTSIRCKLTTAEAVFAIFQQLTDLLDDEHHHRVAVRNRVLRSLSPGAWSEMESAFAQLYSEAASQNQPYRKHYLLGYTSSMLMAKFLDKDTGRPKVAVPMIKDLQTFSENVADGDATRGIFPVFHDNIRLYYLFEIAMREKALTYYSATNAFDTVLLHHSPEDALLYWIIRGKSANPEHAISITTELLRRVCNTDYDTHIEFITRTLTQVQDVKDIWIPMYRVPLNPFLDVLRKQFIDLPSTVPDHRVDISVVMRIMSAFPTTLMKDVRHGHHSFIITSLRNSTDNFKACRYPEAFAQYLHQVRSLAHCPDEIRAEAEELLKQGRYVTLPDDGAEMRRNRRRGDLPPGTLHYPPHLDRSIPWI